MVKKNLRVACLQIDAGSDVRRNLVKAGRLAARALSAKADLIALPEFFYWRGASDQMREVASDWTPRVLKHFQELARKRRVAILLGSLLEASSKKNRYFNTSVLIAENGQIRARYRKIHLFDISLKGKVEARESRFILPGRKIVAGWAWGMRMGLTVCYDVRFPELYRRLAERGSKILFVPANFTQMTGKAHWEPLLRARAIENQVYIIAPAQVGVHPGTGIRSFGTSLIVNPWGEILARGGRKKEGMIIARLDLSYQAKLRRDFPVLNHVRIR